MRNILYVLFALILSGLCIISCSKDPVSMSEADPNPNPLMLDCKTIIIKPLIAAQHESIGTVKLQYEDGLLKVIFWIDNESDWSLLTTHVYVGTDEPQKASPGKFPYKNENPDPKSDVYCISVQPGTCIWFAAHADVQDGSGNQETAWADDDYEFKQGWGWYCYICFPAN